jgi:hypothetical protein
MRVLYDLNLYLFHNYEAVPFYNVITPLNVKFIMGELIKAYEKENTF